MLASQQFQTDAYQEHLLKFRALNRKAFDGLSPATKLALAQYEANKRQAQQDAEARGEREQSC